MSQQYFTVGSRQNLAEAKPFEFFFEFDHFRLRKGLPIYEMKKIPVCVRCLTIHFL